MKTKELFEELRTIQSGLGCMDEGCDGCAYEEKERERIEKELEASIRKEQLQEILDIPWIVSGGEWNKEDFERYALSNGITLN